MLGVVLAGGEGRRMGRDKALIEQGGEPLWRRQLRVLKEAGAQTALVARRRDQQPLEGAPCIFDAFPDSGPMSGIHAALSAGDFPLVAILAVDMPGVDAAWFTWLKGLCGPGVGAAAEHDQSIEPLAAIYPGDILAEVAGRIGRRELSARRLVEDLARAGRMRLAPIPGPLAGKAASLNERA
jgi:molybdopterin-guanine dinucleotide biosynthesis protein A